RGQRASQDTAEQAADRRAYAGREAGNEIADRAADRRAGARGLDPQGLGDAADHAADRGAFQAAADAFADDPCEMVAKQPLEQALDHLLEEDTRIARELRRGGYGDIAAVFASGTTEDIVQRIEGAAEIVGPVPSAAAAATATAAAGVPVGEVLRGARAGVLDLGKAPHQARGPVGEDIGRM